MYPAIEMICIKTVICWERQEIFKTCQNGRNIVLCPIQVVVHVLILPWKLGEEHRNAFLSADYKRWHHKASSESSRYIEEVWLYAELHLRSVFCQFLSKMASLTDFRKVPLPNLEFQNISKFQHFQKVKNRYVEFKYWPQGHESERDINKVFLYYISPMKAYKQLWWDSLHNKLPSYFKGYFVFCTSILIF